MFQVTEKFQLSFNANYTESEAGFDTMYMEGNTDALVGGDYDYTMVNGFSDLEYAFYELGVKTDYQFTDILAGYTEFAYANMKDDEPFVYGDLDGSWFLAHVGLRFNF